MTKRMMNGVLASLVIPAAFAVLPTVRKRYGLGVLSIPSIAMLGGLWLWERHAARQSSDAAPR